jgi:hypothetical protein
MALRFIRRSAASYLLLRQKRSRRGPIDTIPDRWAARPAPPWRDPGRSMRRRSPGLRCLRTRCPDDPDDGADLLGCHVAEVRRQHQRPCELFGQLFPWLQDVQLSS